MLLAYPPFLIIREIKCVNEIQNKKCVKNKIHQVILKSTYT